MANKNNLWVEKYRPHKLEDYVFHDETHRKFFTKIIEEKSIPHLLLTGVQGVGKTTIAQILLSACEIDPLDILEMNASDENNVDTMRDKIKSFITTFPMGEYKVVVLEEASHITLSSQAVLKRYMEDYVDEARFILTSNQEHRIIAPVKSRCQHIRFRAPDKEDVTEYVAKILLAEKISFDLELLDQYVSTGYPDIRKIVHLVQQNTHNGTLDTLQLGREVGDYKFELLNLLETDNWSSARDVVCENVTVEEWEEVYRFLYENLEKSIKFKTRDKWEAGIVIIADHLYKHSICADPEINAAAMFIRLSQL